MLYFLFEFYGKIELNNKLKITLEEENIMKTLAKMLMLSCWCLCLCTVSFAKETVEELNAMVISLNLPSNLFSDTIKKS